MPLNLAFFPIIIPSSTSQSVSLEFLGISTLSFGPTTADVAFENNIEGDLYNVGCGEDLSIRELAEMIQGIVGHKGNIVWDESKPDGTPRKLLDVSKLAAKGWQYQIDLQKGLEQTYQWYKNYAPKAEMEKV